MNIELTSQDSATPRLAEFIRRFHSHDILVAMATGVKNEVISNFVELEAKGNNHGWPSQGFYARAARKTNTRVEGESAFVSISQLGITQRYFGGDIHAGVNVSNVTGQLTKYLAVPAREEAYGHRAGEFGGLVVLWGQHGPYALAEHAYDEVSFGKERKDGSRKVVQGKQHGAVMYWLTEVVHQKPDPNVLPSEETMTEAALRSGESWIRNNPKT